MNKENLDSIYKLYMSDIYRYLLFLCSDKYLAEDLLQDTFYRAFLYLEDCPSDNVKPWLFKVAYNCFIDSKRKNKRSLAEEKDFFTGIPDKSNTENAYEIKEQLNLVSRLLGDMPEKQKQALQLCVFRGFSYKEAAETMKISLSHLKILIYRARQDLKEKLEREDLFE